MLKSSLWVPLVLLFAVGVAFTSVQASQVSTPSPTGSNASDQIPVAVTDASQTQAKAVYGYDCSMCHGPMGRGKTDLGKDATGAVSDLTNPATIAHFSNKELHDIILNGKGKMPGEKGRLNEDGVWNMVTYVRSFSKSGVTLAGNPIAH